MNLKVLTEDVQVFIQTHRNEQPAEVALRKSPFGEISSAALATQIAGLQKAEKKIPDWVNQQVTLYYPEKLNLEQCSSSVTARFKAGLIETGTTLADVTGGFGVDSYYFAQQATQVVHCEMDTVLSAIVQHNFAALKAYNIECHTGDGIAFLHNSVNTFDYVYSDPSRRIKNQKVFRLEDCEPNILALQELFFQKARILITKLAPLLDITAALQALQAVRDVYIISVDNDCKELLFIQEKGYEGQANIHAVRFSHGQQQQFSFDYDEEHSAAPSFSSPRTYLYEPDVALTKAGAFKTLATRYELHKLHRHSHLYTSYKLLKDFPGKIIRIEHTLPFSIFKKQNQLTKANVIAKNFPLKVADIRKKWKIKEGGDNYLYFTTGQDEQQIVILGQRIK